MEESGNAVVEANNQPFCGTNHHGKVATHRYHLTNQKLSQKSVERFMERLMIMVRLR